MIEDSIPARALAVFAHPDDPEVGCGGTLARWTAAGSEVHLVIANRGDKGSSDPSVDPDALAAGRAEEVARAAAVLGLASVEHLGYPDGDIDDDAALRTRIVEIVRRRQPTALIAPDPTAVFFGDGYVNHRDHRQLGWAVLDSVVPAAMPLYVPEAGPAHQVELLLLSGTLEADAWVDIGAVLDVKVAAVACHESRLGRDPGLIAAILEERAREEGARAGVSCAEAFRRLRFTGTG
ncbi:MAG TPA: PIG-L deacetylase family protein [Acidimicrobiales bacterium]|nr:PIG-L deacetylase family protein [Acidimicrobiales bacterium]